MCVHNESKHYILRALRFLRQASGRCLIDVVIVDDGSERTETIQAISLIGTMKSVCVIRNPKSIGLTKSLNIGLQYCKAQFVARHDADDWSEPDRILRQVRFLEKNPDYVLVGSQAMLHMENGRKLWKTRLPVRHSEIVDMFPRGNPFCHGSVVFRRSAAEAVGGYRESLPCSQDYDFFWRLSEIGKVANLNFCLYHLRRSGRSISARRAEDQWCGCVLIRNLAQQRACGGEDVPTAEAAVVMAAAACDLALLGMRRKADNLLLGGSFVPCLLAYVRVIRERPINPLGYAALTRAILFIAFPWIRVFLFGLR